jgi:hypothetical protein
MSIEKNDIKIKLPSIEEQKTITEKLDIYNQEIELARKWVLNNLINDKMKNEKDVQAEFINFLITNLDFKSENIVLEKKIENSKIDLLIVDNNKIKVSSLAIVEFKSHEIILGQDTISQMNKYRNLLNNQTIPCFLFNGIELFVLQSYGWQKISITDFPKIDQLK